MIPVPVGSCSQMVSFATSVIAIYSTPAVDSAAIDYKIDHQLTSLLVIVNTFSCWSELIKIKEITWVV